jgi:hypothetical protein
MMLRGEELVAGVFEKCFVGEHSIRDGSPKEQIE